MNHLKERMKKNMEKYKLKYENNDDNKSVKAKNDKFIIINFSDKDKRVETLKNDNKSEETSFDQLTYNTLRLKSGVENSDTNSYKS